jgi:hypothetical protein
MPLHDWRTTKGWSGLHLAWIVEIARHIRPQLPEDYRVYIGTSPVVAVDPPWEPDFTVRGLIGSSEPPAGVLEQDEDDPFEPDREFVVPTLEADRSVYIERHGRLIAVIELVSPGRRDWTERKAKYLTRYLGYLTNRVHLLLVDLDPEPGRFSFADEIAWTLGVSDEPPLPAPFAVSYRVSGQGAFGGGFLALRRKTMIVGQPLPSVPLSLAFPEVVQIDLEATYMQAATFSYLA